MAQSIKIEKDKDVYWDTSAITHNRSLLKDTLDELNNKITNLMPVVAWKGSLQNRGEFTITLNTSLSNYKYYEVIYEGYRGNSKLLSSGKIPVEYGTLLVYPESTSYGGNRIIEKPSGNTMLVRNGSLGNQICIPYQIILYK